MHSYREGHLHFQNDDLRNGCYEELEQWLMKHQIGFIRWSAGYGEFLPEKVHYRKRIGFRSYPADDNGNTLVHEDHVTCACRALEQGRPDRAYRLLTSSTPNHLPPLPPLTIDSRRRP